MPRVLAGDDVGRGKNRSRAEGQVFEVSDRRPNQIEGARLRGLTRVHGPDAGRT